MNMNVVISPNLNGPENAPTKHYSALYIVVTVYNPNNDDEIERQETIDYGNFDHRKWLGRITFWAISNGYVVETMSKVEFDKMEKK